MTTFRVLLTTAIALSLVSCFSEKEDIAENPPPKASGSSEGKSSESVSSRERINELRKVKRDLENELKELERKPEENKDLQKQEIEIVQQLEIVRNYAGSLDDLEKSLSESLKAWQQATWNSFRGVTLPEITTVDGRNFTQIEILQVTEDSLKFKHSTGTETVEIVQLPVSLRRNLIHPQTVLAGRN